MNSNSSQYKPYKKLSSIIGPQTKTLLLCIIVGFILICLLAFTALNTLKYEYDSNFSIHIKEIQFLRDTETLSYPFPPHISQQLYEILQRAAQNSEGKSLFYILHTLHQRLFLPDSYRKLESLQQNQNDTIKRFYALWMELENLYASNPTHPTDQAILQKTSELHSLISTIINIRLHTAAIQSQTIDSIYRATCIALFVFIVIILLSIIFLTQNALSLMNKHEQELQQTIKDKTLELESINQNLQEIIRNEVEFSRKRDRIMYQQDRLASLGEMIQNIAHQWRQPLNSLMIIIQSFKLKFYNHKLDEKFIDSQTEYGLKIAKNMSETIENFRNFFQPNKVKEPFSLKESILDSIALIDFVLKQNNIEILTHFDHDFSIHGYKNAFSQVILNLLKNAQDAIIERQVKHGVCEISLEEKYDKILISLKDNAGGIKEDAIDKVFEPYFTTKHKSVGTGIGLFMTKEIIEKQMQGTIQCANIHWGDTENPHYGAIFTIQIPQTESTKIPPNQG